MNRRRAVVSAEELLGRINRRLAAISDAQHRLARRKVLLQEQATRLRLGVPPNEVLLVLQRARRQELRVRRTLVPSPRPVAA